MRPDSLGQDELVLRRQSQPISLAAMSNVDLARTDEEIAAIDPVVADRNIAAGGRNIGRIVTGPGSLFFRNHSDLLSRRVK